MGNTWNKRRGARRILMAVAGVGLGASAGVGIGFGCAAGTTSDAGGSGGASAATQSTNGTFMSGTMSTGAVDPDAACAKFSAEGKQASASILLVLDKSASMATNNKWSTAQLAVVSAIDNDAFDNISLGLVTFPQSYSDPPQCLCDFYGLDFNTCKQLVAPGVSCGVSGLPQVAIGPAGTEKSNASSGVRHEIYNYLVNNNPLSNSDDGSPIYGAMVAGYAALANAQTDRRILILLTDGGFSCTSLASPTRPGYSDGACPDWEYPDTVNALIKEKRDDASKPVNTFIVGLPGSNTAGEMQGSFATAPYHMKLALSTYAVTGSAETVDPTCDSGLTFTQGGGDPAKPCHIDLSTGNFDSTVLADAIAAIRGKALGCTYQLPDPPPGETIDPSKVNVQTTTNGAQSTLPKRANATDMCTADAGCWDYTMDGQIQLVGKACEDVGSGATTKVEIYVGCSTIVK